MRRTKEQKGITLIALIITIVVLLILAVVAINSIQNDGILSHAGNTANTYNQAVKNEQQQLQNYLDYLDQNNGGSKTYAAYTVGQEVKILKEGVEHRFYVIENSDETKEKVLLFAKENISQTPFSSTSYWDPGDTKNLEYPYDLTETGEPDANHYAARAAYDYGSNLGGNGRLITYNEVINLLKDNENKNMIYRPSGNDIIYWVGSAMNANFPYLLVGILEDFDCANVGTSYGLRPVVEISKDLVELVSAE